MQEFTPPAATPARKVVQRWQAHNRRHWEFEKDLLLAEERAPFVCECTSADCLHAVELTMHEYDAAHMCPNCCAVRPGHILTDDGGRVILREPHFWVVKLNELPATPVPGISAIR